MFKLILKIQNLVRLHEGRVALSGVWYKIISHCSAFNLN